MSKKIVSCNNANMSNDNSASKIQNAHVHENLNDDELVSLLAGVLSLEIN
jgi:predicted SAM-dependent methyltransferase